LSGRLGSEVGNDTAKQDFIDHLLSAFAFQFRRKYCSSCPVKAQCMARYCDERSCLH
jgi:hypothetical protein